MKDAELKKEVKDKLINDFTSKVFNTFPSINKIEHQSEFLLFQFNDQEIPRSFWLAATFNSHWEHSESAKAWLVEMEITPVEAQKLVDMILDLTRVFNYYYRIKIPPVLALRESACDD